jgi:hypothetical protein
MLWYFLKCQSIGLIKALMRLKQINIALILLLSLLSKKTYSQWDPIYTNDSIVFNSIHFFGVDTGIIIGNNQLDTSWIFRTFDGGQTWDTSRVCNYSFQRMFFVNDDTGFISATDTSSIVKICLFKTTDQGITWTLTNDSIGAPSWASNTFTSLAFLNSMVGFVAAEDHLWRTTDGGVTFTPLSSFPMSWCSNMCESNDTIFFSSDWDMGFTGDAGANFDTNLVYNPASFVDVNSYGNKVYFSGTGHDGAFLFYPTSYYAKWAVYDKSTGMSSWIDFVTHEFIYTTEVTSNNIFLGASKLFVPHKPIFKSIDNGNSFYTQGTTESGGWSTDGATEIECLNDSLCYALIGRNIYKTTNSGGPLIELMGINSVDENNIFSIYPNPSTGIINLKFNIESQSALISVTNIIGKNILNKNLITSINTQIDLSNQPKGMYIVTIKTNAGVHSKKIILE